MVYCVGENLDVYGAPPSKVPRHANGKSNSNAQMWFQVTSSLIIYFHQNSLPIFKNF